MPKVIKFLITPLSMWTLFAFVFWEPNPANWEPIIRLFAILGSYTILLVQYAVMEKNDANRF